MVPNLSLFPDDDLAFVVEASRVVARVTSKLGASEAALEATTKALRRHYPNVTIRRREQLASFGDLDVLWYVFRDGRIRPPDWRRERHYRALAQARRTLAESRRALVRSVEVTRRAGYGGWTPRDGSADGAAATTVTIRVGSDARQRLKVER